MAACVDVTVHRQTDLLQLVLAGTSSSRLAGLLHRRQKQAHQHSNNGDDDEQYNECDGPPSSVR